ETAGAGTEEAGLVDGATSPHRLQPLSRFECTNQNCARNSLTFANEVEAPVDTVGAVHVRDAAREEHRRVPLGPAAEAVGGRILVVVRLDLDDHAADAVDVELRADQLGRDVVHAALEVHSCGLCES